MNKTSFMGETPVNRIGFGAMQLAGPGVFGPPRDPDAARAVRSSSAPITSTPLSTKARTSSTT